MRDSPLVSSSDAPSEASIRPAGMREEMTGELHPNDRRSLGELTGDLLTNAQEIVRDEVRLAKAEIRQEIKTAIRGAAMLIAGAVLGLFALGLALATAVIALAIVLDLWLAALLVTIAMATVAVILLLVGRSRIQEVDPKPEETVASVKETVEWTKQQAQRR